MTNRISPRSPEYRQTTNSLIIALQEARSRFAKAKEYAEQTGRSTLASDCQLYIEDISEQIGLINRNISRAAANTPNVAIAEL